MRASSSLSLLLLTAACAGGPAADAGPPPATVVPTSRGGAEWTERHAAHVAAARAGGRRVVFVGDSITQGWEGAGKQTWEQVWAPRAALNAGISGDRTQHVLWRLDHGLLDALATPANDVRAFVVMIGTNNSNGDEHSAAEIAAGIVAVVQRLRVALPDAKVLLLAIFPRGERPDAQRAKNADASRLAAAAFAADDHVVCRDLAERFVTADGTLPAATMPDFLHLSAAAYGTWADAIVADVDAMLQ